MATLASLLKRIEEEEDRRKNGDEALGSRLTAVEAQATALALQVTELEREAEPEPTPESAPEPPAPTTMIVGLDVDAGWGSNAGTDAKGCVPFARSEDASTKVRTLLGAGLKLNVNFAGPYNTGGVKALNADQWVSEALAFYKANCTTQNTPIIEVLNEPFGSWFWGGSATSEANGVAYRELVRKTSVAFRGAFGAAAPKIIATVDGGGLNAAKWWTAECPTFCDGVIVHPYGGTGSKATSALGNRSLVEAAHALPGNPPVYITEVGWPTAVGKPNTGDSLQWTETEQAANLTSFIAWARSTGYVAQVIYFNWHDFGTNNWYGVVRPNGSHKPSYAALKAA